jgi:hypothetical protein
MLKRLPHFFTLLAGLLICYCFIAAKSPTATQQYDYIAITQKDDLLEISSTSSKFESVKFKKKSKGYASDFSALLNKVNELEKQGYKLVQNNVYPISSSYVPNNYMILRKPKP